MQQLKLAGLVHRLQHAIIFQELGRNYSDFIYKLIMLKKLHFHLIDFINEQKLKDLGFEKLIKIYQNKFHHLKCTQ